MVGVLFAKDLLKAISSREPVDFDWKSMLKEPYYVYENTKINGLFHTMKKNRQHLAFVVDEFGGVEGIVTMEDIIEEVFGNITDEHGHDEGTISKIGDRTYLIAGFVAITDLKRTLSLEIHEDDRSYKTIAGFVIDIIKTIPDEPSVEPIGYQNLEIYITEVDRHRIIQVKIIINDVVEDKP